MKGNKLNRKNGFSLAETLVTVLIFMILAGGLFAILQVGNDSYQTNQAKIELQQNLRQAIDWMKNDLRQASGDSIVNVAADGNPEIAITFKVPSSVSGGAIVWNANSIKFALGGADGDQLIRSQGADTKVLAQNISLLEFTRQPTSAEILEIALEGEATATGRTINYQMAYKVQLRN